MNIDNEKYFYIERPIMDIKGIDLIIRKLINKKSYYLELQIKSRSSEAKYPYRFADLKVEERDNYYFIFYTENNNEEKMWLVPSTEIKFVGNQNKTGKNKGKYNIEDCQKECNKYEVKMNELSEKINDIFEKLSRNNM